jgi:signal transduction histidine kinase
MNLGIQSRVTGFILAIGLMVSLIVWTAYTAWQRIGELRERLTTVQLESFSIADHFQQTILKLNNTILVYQIRREPAAWESYLRESEVLDRWIDEQVDKLKTDKEKNILQMLNTAYDDYRTAAREIGKHALAVPEHDSSLVEFARFQKESERLLSLGYRLAAAHHDSLNQFLTDSKRSVTLLLWLLLGALTLLLVLGGRLALVVYSEMIAPLRTKLVESRALLERQEKLAALGMLAAGVAHEIRNPLTAIKARLFALQKHSSAEPTASKHTEVIAGEISRLERIVKDFLLFARPSDPEFTCVSAESPLAEVQSLLAPQLEKQRIRLVMEKSPPAHIRVDQQQIKQVLINLVQNAADSIDHDGTITLRARAESKHPDGTNRKVVILEVADTGKGIPPEVQKRLFDPFFTTKDSGTGLGLPIAARIVEKHNGVLQYQTQLNRGTTFGIVLPQTDHDETHRENPSH